MKRIRAEKTKLVTEGKIKKDKPLPEIVEEERPFELPVGREWTRLATVSIVNPRNEVATDIEAAFVPMTKIGTQFHGKEPRNNELNILAAPAGALLRCRSLAGNGHAARPASCIASRQHTHICPTYYFSAPKHQHESRKWSEIKSGFTHFAEGDIGVAKITPCFENSKACVFSGLKNGIGAGTTQLHIVRPVNGTLSARYVLAYLKAPRFLHVGESHMTGTAGQKRLPKYFVESNPFPPPPLPEQHRIVAKVDELMALCDQLADRLKAARELSATYASAATEAVLHGAWHEARSGTGQYAWY